MIASDAVEAEVIRARERDVTIEITRDTGPHVVAGSPTALRRVLNTHLDNALGHVDPGGHIDVFVSRTPAEVMCVIADDGAGFDPRDADTLFARFAHGNHGSTRRFGLGLAPAIPWCSGSATC